MQSKSKKQTALETESSSDSPYRMGNWTVTMLKEELRVRQLPISGKKAELIDRLESNSPVKASPAPNKKESPYKAANSPLKVQESPAKVAESPKVLAAKSLLSQEQRGRSRSRSSSPSHRMLTRSRSTSLSQGTFLTWSRSPLGVMSNFMMAQVDTVKCNSVFFASFAAFIVSAAVLLYFNSELRAVFFGQLNQLTPFALMYLDGFASNLGFKRSRFRLYISRAASFMFDCSSGNIDRNTVTGRLRCSAAPLSHLNFGLPGRLFWLEREHFFSWSFGAISASVLVYFITEKCRTALPLQINRNFRSFLAFCNRFIYALAIFVPFELVGLISGLSGFDGQKFGTLMVLRAFLSIPLQLSSRIFFSKYQKVFESQISRLPQQVLDVSSSIFHFFDSSSYVMCARQALNAALYLFLCAAVIQVTANTRVYKLSTRNN